MHRPALALTAAALLLTALPSAAAVPGSAVRDVREWACAPAGTPDAGFSDTSTSALRYEIDCLVAQGLETVPASGPTASLPYRPQEVVPRVRMAVLLFGVLTRAGAAPPDAPNRFSDLSEAEHGSQAVRAASALAGVGVVRGTTSTSFAPDTPVTREQLATFVVRAQAYAASVGRAPAFAPAAPRFDDGVSGVHAPAVGALAAAGIVQGTGPRTFAPRATVSRAQFAAYAVRWVDVLVEAGAVPARVRDNEDTRASHTVTPPDPATGTARYTLTGLRPGLPYRVTLVATDAFTRAEPAPPGRVEENGSEGSRVLFRRALPGGVADPGATTAVVRAVDGAAVTPSRSVVVVPGPAGVVRLDVTADGPASVAPFVYCESGCSYPSYDTRLEVGGGDLRPLERFAVGPVSAFG